MKKKHLTPEDLGLFRNCMVKYFDYFTNQYEIGTLQGIADNNHFWIEENHNGQEIDKCKPILRPLNSITDDELRELFMLEHFYDGITMSYVKFHHRDERFGFFSVQFNCEYVINRTGKKTGIFGTMSFRKVSPKQFQYLLSKHFDIFGWIEAGLAVHSVLYNSPEPEQKSTPVPDINKNLFPPIS